MLAVYLFCLVAGGLLVGASALLGGKEADLGDAHVGDADLGDADLGGAHVGDADIGGDAHGPGEATPTAGWLPFLSMQFWTFALAFFGLTGTALTLLGLASFLPTLIAALAVGLGSGTAVSYVLRRLRADTVSSSIGEKDFVGRSAVVRLPIAADSPGKIRLTVKEQVIDLVATTDEKEPIAAGEEVLVIQINETRAQVVRAVRVEAEGEEVAVLAHEGSRPPAEKKE
ncbi:MAG: DUF1449 family protein [Deltaproteobacteria bacterium]|nr:DUF1449 family protein [Deltaproteobacteria bacterium]